MTFSGASEIHPIWKNTSKGKLSEVRLYMA